MKYSLLFLGILSLSLANAQANQLTLVSYNLLNFPDGRNDCGTTNINPPNRTDTLRKILGYLKPDILVACEIQYKAGADSVLSRSLNVFGATNYAMAPFINSSGGGGGLSNALFYNTDKLIFLRQKPVLTGVRDINHYTLMVKDPNIAQHRDTVFIDVLMAHLKAGSTSADELERANQTRIVRAYVEARPAMRKYFFCGDLNVYSSNEAGYQNLVNGGQKPFFDPIFSPGNWNNNAAFASVHTQSPRISGSWACGSTGGLDDRFDQILVTQNVLSGADRLSYVTNSYKAIGNDGMHYNSSLLNAPVNTQYPDSVVKALFYMSDHLPVKVNLQPNLPTNNGLALTYNHNGPLCVGNTNGFASVTPLYGQAPFTFLWDANAGNQTTATATNLAPGSYCVLVTDAAGLTDQVCFEIESVPTMAASAFVSSSTYLCDGQSTVLVNGGTPPYAYSWNDPMGQNTQTASQLCPGSYICTISDQGTCSIQVTAAIAIVGLEDLGLTADSFLVFPNPFLDQIEINNSSNQFVNFDYVIVQDVQGKIVVESPYLSLEVNQSIYLNTNNLEKGVYFLECKKNEERLRYKMVK